MNNRDMTDHLLSIGAVGMVAGLVALPGIVMGTVGADVVAAASFTVFVGTVAMSLVLERIRPDDSFADGRKGIMRYGTAAVAAIVAFVGIAALKIRLSDAQKEIQQTTESSVSTLPCSGTLTGQFSGAGGGAVSQQSAPCVTGNVSPARLRTH